MSILIDHSTKVIVQGLTGKEGTFHAIQMQEYGTQVVAGVTPGKAGQDVNGIPVYNTVAEAVAKTGADTSIIFVPAAASADAACEAAEAGIRLVVLITEHIPVLDMVRCKNYLASKGTLLIGPNCPGIISPGQCKVGIMPAYIHKKGSIGLISRSGTLTYEAVHQLTTAGLGQSTCIGIGGDAIPGLKFVELLEMFRTDPETEAVCIIGEIGGDNEEKAAAYIMETKYPKPVFGFIAGLTAPAGKRMGHAGAIISGSAGTAAEKMDALTKAGVHVVKSPAEIGKKIAEVLKK